MNLDSVHLYGGSCVCVSLCCKWVGVGESRQQAGSLAGPTSDRPSNLQGLNHVKG